jgi:hypothetical protein
MQCQAVIIDLCVKYVPKRQGRQDIHTNRAAADTTELISKTNVTSFSTLCEFVLSKLVFLSSHPHQSVLVVLSRGQTIVIV